MKTSCLSKNCVMSEQHNHLHKAKPHAKADPTTQIDREIRRLSKEAIHQAEQAEKEISRINQLQQDSTKSQEPKPKTEEEKERDARKTMAAFMPGSGVPPGGW